MARIISTGTALPPHKVPQSVAKEFARAHFAPHVNEIEKYLPVYDHSGIDHRYFCMPPQWYLSPTGFAEKNRLYIEWATKLGHEAAERCLQNAGVALRAEIDHIIFVSTTGMATPSIDARLINLLGLPAGIRRTPIWGLGCVGGAAGLIAAHDYIKAYPEAKVLLVAVELCGLTFLFDDLSVSNLVATALFGDGAAAVLLAGDGEGLETIAGHSRTWPDSLDVMGWNFLENGLQVVFSKSIPAIVKRHARENITEFLAGHDLGLGALEYYLIHPGGPRVIEAYQRALGLPPDKTRLIEQVLRDHGNMSSVTVLFILDEFMRNGYERGKLALLTALGPGFTSQSLLLRT